MAGGENGVRDGKKPFNKKEWRRQKYSKKFKVEQWEQRRRKNVLHSYYKELRKMPGYSGNERNSTEPNTAENKGRMVRLNPYQAAQLEYERKQAEKSVGIEEARKVKEERAEALAKYHAKKTEVFKKLSRKTKKGQPVMKGRMELLLEKLQKSVES